MDGNLSLRITSDILILLCTWIEYRNLAPSEEELNDFYIRYYNHNYQRLYDLLWAARVLRFQNFLDVYDMND